MTARTFRPEIFLISLAAILLEIGYTRVFSYKMEQFVELVKLVGGALLLFLPFLAIGIVLARIFSARPDDLPRLYYSDLIGAGLGCALCVPLFASVRPPSAILLGGAVLALASLRLAVTWRPAWLGAPLAALLAAGALMSWAVNGFFSVMSSVLATMVSMTFGFRVVLLQALLSYAIAVFALTRIPAPRQCI